MTHHSDKGLGAFTSKLTPPPSAPYESGKWRTIIGPPDPPRKGTRWRRRRWAALYGRTRA